VDHRRFLDKGVDTHARHVFFIDEALHLSGNGCLVRLGQGHERRLGTDAVGGRHDHWGRRDDMQRRDRRSVAPRDTQRVVERPP
jgi:hypothetical protein